MSTKRERLLELLRQPTLADGARRLAAKQLGVLVDQTPWECFSLVPEVRALLCSPHHSVRAGAALALHDMVAALPWHPRPLPTTLPLIERQTHLLQLRSLHLPTLLAKGDLLASSDLDLEAPFKPPQNFPGKGVNVGALLGVVPGLSVEDAAELEQRVLGSPTPTSSTQQSSERPQLELELAELEGKLAQESSARLKNTLTRRIKELRKRLDLLPPTPATPLPTPPSAPKPTPVATLNTDPESNWRELQVWPFQSLYLQLAELLLDSRWEVRHGAALGLASIFKAAPASVGRVRLDVDSASSLPEQVAAIQVLARIPPDIAFHQDTVNAAYLEHAACLLLELLARERFTDFSNDISSSPVAEAALSAVSLLLPLLHQNGAFFSKLALEMTSVSSSWQTRKAGFAILKSSINIGAPTERRQATLEAVFNGLQDSAEDVRYTAAEVLTPSTIVVHGQGSVHRLLVTCWAALTLGTDDYSDLSAAPAPILSLISELLALTPELAPQFGPSFTLLFPFLHHRIRAVRRSARVSMIRLVATDLVIPAHRVAAAHLVIRGFLYEDDDEALNELQTLWALLVRSSTKLFSAFAELFALLRAGVGVEISTFALSPVINFEGSQIFIGAGSDSLSLNFEGPFRISELFLLQGSKALAEAVVSLDLDEQINFLVDERKPSVESFTVALITALWFSRFAVAQPLCHRLATLVNRVVQPSDRFRGICALVNLASLPHKIITSDTEPILKLLATLNEASPLFHFVAESVSRCLIQLETSNRYPGLAANLVQDILDLSPDFLPEGATWMISQLSHDSPFELKRPRDGPIAESGQKRIKLEGVSPSVEDDLGPETRRMPLIQVFRSLGGSSSAIFSLLPFLGAFLAIKNHRKSLLLAFATVPLCGNLPDLPLSDMARSLIGHILLMTSTGPLNLEDVSLLSLNVDLLVQCAVYAPAATFPVAFRDLVQLRSASSEWRRLVAVLFLERLMTAFSMKILPWLGLFIMPLLQTASDSVLRVRRVASRAFSTMLRVAPLGLDAPRPDLAPDSPLLPLLNESRGFLQHFIRRDTLPPFQVESLRGVVNQGVTLRDYQLLGVQWLLFLQTYSLHGILADDMGLGKTLQTLTALALSAARRRGAEGGRALPDLIVCPSSLVAHWPAEARKFCVSYALTPYAGAPAQRQEQLEALAKFQRREGDGLVVSYDVLKRDIAYFAPLSWNYVVLDEGHAIRNPKSTLTAAVKQLRGAHRLLLSGTPVQNHVAEVWSQFDYLMPGFLGDATAFSSLYTRPILRSKDTKANSAEWEAGQRALAQLHRQILPFILRRQKEDVAKELPRKEIMDRLCDLSPAQTALYQPWSASDAATALNAPARGTHVFQALAYLRKLCTHPLLVQAEGTVPGPQALDDGPKLRALEQLLLELGIVSEEEDGITQVPSLEGVAPHKALIFCQLGATLDLVERLVLRRFPALSYLRLDGRTPPAERVPLCARFNGDSTIGVLLLSTGVGSLGLNLASADTVVFMEHDWNPMKDLQAMDRAHRLTSTRPVSVYRLIMRDTLEEQIMGLQAFKLNVARAIVNHENQSGASNADLLGLFESAAAVRAAAQEGPTVFDALPDEN